MNFILIGSSAVNVSLIVEIKRIAVNNFTVYLSDGRTYAGLTRVVIEPILNMINISDLL